VTEPYVAEPRVPQRPELQPDGGPSELIPAEILAVEAVTAGELEVEARKRLGIMGWLTLGWMVLIVGAALLAPILPIDDPNAIDPQAIRAPIGTSGHVLGADALGRDLLSRVIWGARSSLFVAGASVVFGLVVGGFLGLLAGYRKGKIETILVGFFDVLLAFPQLVLALSLVAVFANKTSDGDPVSSTRRLMILVLALGIVSVPILARITRANTLAWAQREFVVAARAQGAKDWRILFREILPNVLPAMFSISLLGVAVVIVAEGGLSILGIGVQLPTPSWGNMVAEGRSVLAQAPQIVFVPSVAIFLTVLSLNYLGDVVRARFDVRESAL